MTVEQMRPGLAAEHIGTAFLVLDDPAQVFSLTLTGVVENSKTERSEAFSLFFHGPESPYMPQGTRKLKHEKLGEIEIFLVPVARDKDGFQYEAVFNLLFFYIFMNRNTFNNRPN